MKPKVAEKISFNDPIKNVTRVKYKDVYVGKIIFNENQKYEWQEKNRSSFAMYNIQPKTFSRYGQIKSYVTDRLISFEKTNKKSLKTSVKFLTDKGREFMKKFLKNTPVKRSSLIDKEKLIADSFVQECLLEKGTLDGKVVYWSTLTKV
jgi:hypothetical protein